MPLRYNSVGIPKFGRSTIEPQDPLEHQSINSIKERELEIGTLERFGLENIGAIKFAVQGDQAAVLREAAETLKEVNTHSLLNPQMPIMYALSPPLRKFSNRYASRLFTFSTVHSSPTQVFLLKRIKLLRTFKQYILRLA